MGSGLPYPDFLFISIYDPRDILELDPERERGKEGREGREKKESEKEGGRR